MFPAQTKFDEKTKTWFGPKSAPPLYNPDVALGRVLENAMNLLGDRVVQVCHDDGSEMTASEMKTLSVRAAIAFRDEYGLKSGDRITFVAKNSKYLGAAVFGAVFNGNPFCPLEPFLIVPEMVKLLTVSQPSLIICDEEYEELSKEAVSKCGLDIKVLKLLGNNQAEFFKTSPKEFMFRVPDVENRDQIVALMCSSGTTGLPKLIPFYNASMSTMSSMFNFGGSVFCMSYIYWASGIMTLFVPVLSGLRRIVSNEQFSTDLVIEILTKYKVDTVFMIPYHIQLLEEEAAKQNCIFPNLRILFPIGCKIMPQVLDKCRPVMPNVTFIHAYGLTEGGGVSTFVNSTEFDCQGSLIPDAQVRILDDDGNRLGIGETGEICIVPTSNFKGYFNNEEMTKKVLSDDGWLLTGDRGYFNEKGLLYVLDRKKDSLKYANYLITATEIELVISQIPGVQFACVVGIPDPLCEQLPAVLIIKEENHPLTGQEVCEYIGNHLNERKQMRGGVYFVDSLPMTSTSGKFKKNEIVKIATELYNAKKYDYIFKY